MIGIINTGETDANGAHRYRLQINQWLITEFHHLRSDGLAVCLERAAAAARVAEEDEKEAICAMGELFEEFLPKPHG